MSLVTFRSRAAGEFFMLSENARQIFDILGRTPAERGVVTAEQVPEALARLTAAVEAERAQLKAAAKEKSEDGNADRAAAARISLGQRAMPLIDMLRAAQKRGVDVTWGI
jgi:hypothetical protein